MLYSSVFFKQLVIIHFLMLITSSQDYSLLRHGTEEQRSKVPGSTINILYNLDVYYIVAEAIVKLSSLKAFLPINLIKTKSLP